MSASLAQISIHTLRVEGDMTGAEIKAFRAQFQSTPSAWRVTFHDGLPVLGINISIHTLRVEGDCKSAQKSRTLLFKSNRPAEKLPTGRA